MARLRPRGVGVQSQSIVINGAEVRLARFVVVKPSSAPLDTSTEPAA